MLLPLFIVAAKIRYCCHADMMPLMLARDIKDDIFLLYATICAALILMLTMPLMLLMFFRFDYVTPPFIITLMPYYV